jgi:hypothetical protein
MNFVGPSVDFCDFLSEDQNLERKVRKICKKPPNDSAVISTHSWRNGESKVNEMFARIKKKTTNLEPKLVIHGNFESYVNENNPQNKYAYE